MTPTTLITLNALLDLAVVVALFSIVRYMHRLHREPAIETARSTGPLPVHVVLTADEVRNLARAA